MPNQFTGILPYSSDDSSIILKCSLRSLAEVQAAGGIEPNAGTNGFDSVLGMRAIATNGGVRFTTVPGYQALDNAGQVSFEVETSGVCVPNAALPSAGVDRSSNDYFLVLRDGAAANYFRYLHDANERPFVGWRTASVDGGQSPSGSSVTLTSHGKEAMTRITFSWVGNRYDFYVNGVFVFSGTRNGIPAGNIGNRIEILSGAGLGNSAVGTYCRNLLVSTRPVMRPTHVSFKRPGIVGHSFAGRARFSYLDFYRDQPLAWLIQAALAERGIGYPLPTDNSTIFFSSGAAILNSSGNPLLTPVTAAAAAGLDSVVYFAGTNDALNPSWRANRSQVLTDLKGHITTLMGGAFMRKLVLCNVPSTKGNASNYAATQSDRFVQEINSDFDTIPGWWDSSNPSRKGQVVVADNFDLLGGLNPDPNYFVGLVLGTLTDLHLSAAGHIPVARQIADLLADAALA